jgi:alpha-amylase/alpha-mannosidase (GH57 family)
MHQPYYREGLDGDFRLPWVYLHTMKDYSDMAMHLERHPDMSVVVNFAPVLLEQIDDYRIQLSDYLKHGQPMRDPLLNFLAGVHPIPEDTEIRRELIRACRRAHGEHMINPYPVFVDLLEMVTSSYPTGEPEIDLDRLPYLDAQYFLDLLTWFHLAWLGHSLKQTDTARYLISKGRYFTHQDRQSLIELIHSCHDELLPRYRNLSERGQIELSMTPYAHPIIPLLNSFDNMDCAQPDAPKPAHKAYPAGHERSDWHMRKGMEVFSKYFGTRPNGIWFSEGGISNDAIDLLVKYDLNWTASGEGVWHNSCTLSECDSDEIRSKSALFTPFQMEGTQCCLYFRDDGLSDLVGFEYKNWDPDDAVSNFTSHLVNIADSFGDKAEEHVVTVILDGENAWEYYPDNAWHFLDKLYSALSDHPRIEATVFNAAPSSAKIRSMKKLCPGSWVYGSFSTWIGDPEKNRAWDLLIEAKQAFDDVMASDSIDEASRSRAARQLAICEGSDWFWWFGDYNPSESVRDFDYLFRHQLEQLYLILDKPVPDTLLTPVSTGGDYAESAGTMRRSQI